MSTMSQGGRTSGRWNRPLRKATSRGSVCVCVKGKGGGGRGQHRKQVFSPSGPLGRGEMTLREGNDEADLPPSSHPNKYAANGKTTGPPDSSHNVQPHAPQDDMTISELGHHRLSRDGQNPHNDSRSGKREGTTSAKDLSLSNAHIFELYRT